MTNTTTTKRALIIGGNRFAGARLAARVKAAGYHSTLINRSGTGAADRVIQANRNDLEVLGPQLKDQSWDVIFDTAAYQPQDCESAFRLFSGHKGRYVLVSSTAVYRLGKDISEDDFAAASYAIPDASKRRLKYDEGKKAVEARFAKGAPFRFVAARVPFVLGPDDYTKRLEFHIDHVRTGKKIFVTNSAARINMISADALAEFLLGLATSDLSGPVNYASGDPISFAELMSVIGTILNKAPRFAQKQTATNHSPYDPTSDKYMSLAKAKAAGFEPRSVWSWLPDLVRSTAELSG